MFNFFQNNDVIKRKRQRELANHFELTKPHEEQGTISLAQFGVAFLKIIMFIGFMALGFFLPYDGLRQVLTIGTLAVIGFFTIRFKAIFAERLFVAQFNLTDDTLPESVHIAAEKQHSENFKKVVGLVIFCLVVVTSGGYFGAKKYVAASIPKAVKSQELQQNYEAAKLTYTAAANEGKSSAFLKPLQKEMVRAEKAIKSDADQVQAKNEVLEEASKTELYAYGIAAGGLEFLVVIFLMQLLFFIESKQFEEHKADRANNPQNGAFNGESPKKTTPKEADTEGEKAAKAEAKTQRVLELFEKYKAETEKKEAILQEALKQAVADGTKHKGENESFKQAVKLFKQEKEKQELSDTEFLQNELSKIARTVQPSKNGNGVEKS
jgi:hypothetical protein